MSAKDGFLDLQYLESGLPDVEDYWRPGRVRMTFEELVDYIASKSGPIGVDLPLQSDIDVQPRHVYIRALRVGPGFQVEWTSSDGWTPTSA